MSEYHLNRAAEIIKSVQYATVATSSDNQPWNSPVAHVYDDQLNIYWFSDKEGQHSKNVRANPQVFIVVYDSTVPEGKGEGVYIQATATEVTDSDEVMTARRIKKGDDHSNSADEFLGSAVRRVYKATPSAVWMNDAEIRDGVFIRDYRVEVPVNELKRRLHGKVS